MHGKLRAAADMVKGEETIIRFKPPKNNPGLSEEKDLFKTFFRYEDEETFFKYVNKSSVSAYEVWIEDREIEFAFYVPNEDLEKHYKRQLDTHYSGCDLGSKQGKMVRINEGDYVTAIRFQLDNHYFEPIDIRSGEGGAERSPYRSILGELSLTDDMKAMIQFMFKPAESDWTQLHTVNVSEHAEKVLDRHSYESKLFGLKSKQVEPSAEIKKEVDKIKKQNNSRGFYVDIRLIIAGPNKYEVEEQASQVSNLYENLFESPAGQTLKPDGYDNPEKMKDILLDTAQRNPKYMRQPKAPRAYLHNRFSENTDTLIMSLDELVTIAPIPYEKDFDDLEAMSWADKPLEGAVSGIGDTWEPPSEEEEAEIRERLKGSEAQIDSTVKTPEGAPVREVDPDETDSQEDTDTETVEEVEGEETLMEEDPFDDLTETDEEDTTEDTEDDEEEDEDKWEEDIDDILG